MKLRLTIAALSLVVLCVATRFSLQTVSAAAPPPSKTILITAKRFTFEPADVTLKAGETITLAMRSDDVAHGLRVHELGVDLKAAKGATVQTTIQPSRTGDFVGHCSTFCGSGHGVMTVTFHVVP